MGDTIIKFAVDNLTGLVWSVVGEEVAVPTVKYRHGNPEDAFDMPVRLKTCKREDWNLAGFEWNREIPKKVQNVHRKHWGLDPL